MMLDVLVWMSVAKACRVCPCVFVMDRKTSNDRMFVVPSHILNTCQKIIGKQIRLLINTVKFFSASLLIHIHGPSSLMKFCVCSSQNKSLAG